MQDINALKPYVYLAFDQHGSYGVTDALNDNVLGQISLHIVGKANEDDTEHPNLLLGRRLKAGVSGLASHNANAAVPLEN